jgi:PKD repeat protein
LKNTYFSASNCDSSSPINANFIVQISNLNVVFNGLSSTDSTGTITSWSWSFGDQTPNGIGSIVSHSYATAGTYQVTLTITDNNSQTSTITKTIVVTSNNPPTADFTSTVTGLSVNFNGGLSSDSDGTINSYSWNFGDSQTGTGSNPSHTYSVAGTYNVILTVTDNLGATGTITKAITVSQAATNNPPTAQFTQSVSSLTVNVDGSSSTDSDGQVTSWSWNFGDGSTQSGSAASHSYSNAGTYTITLTVTDNNGATNSVSKSVTVSTSNASPVADFTYSSTSLMVNFNGGASYDTDGNIVSWSWNFGDGQTAGGNNVNHQYSAPGTYQVTLTVTDNKNAQTSITKNVIVTNNLPVVDFTYSIGANNQVSFTSSAYDTDGSISSYRWTFGDGQTAGGTNANHQYVLAGTYNVVLSVTDNYGGVGIKTKSVVISGGTTTPNIPPVSQFTYSINNYNVLFTSSSYDSDGSISSYLWDFGDGQTSTQIGPLTHQYILTGTYSVKLTVVDNNGDSVTSSQAVTIGGGGTTSNKPPIAAFTFWTEPAIGHFYGTSSYDVDGSITNYFWQFGDGSTST